MVRQGDLNSPISFETRNRANSPDSGCTPDPQDWPAPPAEYASLPWGWHSFCGQYIALTHEGPYAYWIDARGRQTVTRNGCVVFRSEGD